MLCHEGVIHHDVLTHLVSPHFSHPLGELGIIFCSFSEALKEYPDLVRKYLGTVVPYTDNKFAALNSAVWSGGSFIYVPPGVHVEIPLQAYFRINLENFGQFERTLIVADEGSFVHYIEGCTAPVYTTDSLHSAVVEIVAKPGARVRYTTIQNWSGDIYNLVTKRALAYENATVEWIDGNIGSKRTMKYPSINLVGEGEPVPELAERIRHPGLEVRPRAPHGAAIGLLRDVKRRRTPSTVEPPRHPAAIDS